MNTPDSLAESASPRDRPIAGHDDHAVPPPTFADLQSARDAGLAWFACSAACVFASFGILVGGLLDAPLAAALKQWWVHQAGPIALLAAIAACRVAVAKRRKAAEIQRML